MQSESTTGSWDWNTFLEWLYLNRVRVGVIAAIVAVILAGTAIFTWKKTQDEVKANAELFALPPLVGASAKATPARAEDFQKVAQNFPDTRAAERAELLAAGILFTDGKYAEAQKGFSKFLEQRDQSPLQAQAAVGLAASLEAQGKATEAIAKYQEVLSKYPGQNIISPTKLTLARLLEGQNKPEEALKLYADLTRSNNPYDPWSAEAGERRELLFQKYPNLKPAPPVMTKPNAELNMPTVPNSIISTSKPPAKP
ncbi:MAG: tetratricopeptide repeat protein [Verrucomicrobiota bacterium]